MKYSIIIPTYNHCDDLLKPCIESVLNYTNLNDFELIVSANGCNDNTKDYLEILKVTYPNLKLNVIWNDNPLGFAKAVNEGIKVATTENIVLLNNDVIFLPQPVNFWIDKLYEPFTSDSQVGISSIFKDFSAPANHYVAIFFCVMIKKAVFDAIGLLSEEYGIGAGEDSEFCILAERAGFKVVEILPSKEYSPVLKTMIAEFPIYHKGEGTVHDKELVKDWSTNFLKNSIKLSKKFDSPWYNNWLKANIKYSIIIPTYNHCDDLLKPCIESLLRHTDFKNTELIVVANGCTDNTKEYFDSIDILHKKLIWVDEPLGYTKSTNLGIKEASGEFVILLNNDTEILPSVFNYWIEKLNEPFVNNEKMALTGTLKLFDHDIQQDFIVFCCAMIRRKVFDQIGILDEIFSPGYGEDIDFSMRVLKHGLQWECVDITTPSDETGMHIGTFPIWHKGNKTFGQIPEYANFYVQRNRQTLIKRYNKENMKYSIVIPTYNHCNDYLLPCIESIKKYTDLSNTEIIVVANGCTDNTRDALKDFHENLKCIWFDEPIGYTKATNEGIKVAQGEYIVLLNNDTVLLEQHKNQWLDTLVKPFLNDSKVGVTGPVKFSWDCGGIIREAMAFWLVMIKKEVFDKIGLLDEIYSPGMGEDGDFCIRAVENDYKLVSVPEDVTGKFEVGIKNFNFPIYHVGNGTFADDHNEKNDIILRNNKILNYRYGLESRKHIDVTIVIPTAHNFDNALKPCLEAVLAYTDLSNKEVIVVANGSKQITRDYLNDHSDRLSYIWSDMPLGYIKAVNLGISKARGKYVVLLDDDSILQYQGIDQWINILQKPFLTEEKVGASGPFANHYEDMGLVLHSGCTMYDTELLKKLGKFDEIYHPGYFSDSDVSMRIWREGYRCVEVPEHNPNKQYVNNMFSINFPVVHTGAVQTMDKNKDIELVQKNRELLYLRHSRNTISLSLQYMFDNLTNVIKGDIHEHMPTLRKYAKECDHVTEFGTRAAVSTYGLMAGKPKTLISYDLYPQPPILRAAEIAKENNVHFAFMERDTRKVTIDPTDLLFIDTLHTYDQVKTELKLHADKARKYIIFHDTVSYGYINEDGSPGGLMPAINEFLSTNTDWAIKEKFENCNGLLVLERVKKINNIKYSIVIPTYNHCDDLLKPCIESILKYTNHEMIEIIVSANGCKDNTRDYVNSLGDVAKLVWSDEPLGYTKATNLGIQQAKGEYVILLNNDTELLPQPTNCWLQMLEQPFNDEPNVGLTGPLELYDRYAASKVLIFFCVMVKRDLFDKIGLLDEIFTPGGGEDIDFTVRANLAGYKSKLITPHSYNQAVGTNTGSFPIWHKDNRTFRDIPEYSRHIVKRNGLINCKRYNKNIKLNLGAGGIEYEGYLSVDKYDARAHIDMDIIKLDFEDNSVEEILASHVFEHLNPYHSLDILREWLRVLKPGGKLIMEMPDIEQLCKRFVTASTGERYGILNAIYGSVNTTGVGGPDNITSPHLFGWWPQSMQDHLMNAGYTNIQFMGEKIPHPESNFRVEANKPGEQIVFIDHEMLKNEDNAGYNDIFGNNNYNIVDTDINNKIIIDIGANCGMFTLRCLELNAKHVYAVEAQPTVYTTKLVPNVGSYRKVTTINKAVLETVDQDVMIENKHYMSTIGTSGEVVKSITLEKIVNDYNLTGDDLVLKLDCESSEFNIVLNSSRELLRKFKVIYMELHGDLNMNPEYRDYTIVENKLKEYGFNCVSNVRYFGYGSNGPIPMNTFVQKYERI